MGVSYYVLWWFARHTGIVPRVRIWPALCFAGLDRVNTLRRPVRHLFALLSPFAQDTSGTAPTCRADIWLSAFLDGPANRSGVHRGDPEEDYCFFSGFYLPPIRGRVTICA
jgi:hypothetical protein